MIKHVVSWKKQPGATEDDLLKIKTALEGLQGRIEGLLHIEVGLDISNGEGSADLVLYSEFSDLDALAAYQAHPAHRAVIPLVQQHCCERRVVDYRI